MKKIEFSFIVPHLLPISNKLKKESINDNFFLQSIVTDNNKDAGSGGETGSLEFGLLQGRIWLAVTSIAFFVGPVLILTCIYVRIFVAASKNSRDIRKNSFHHQPLIMASSMTSKLTDEDDEINQVNEQDVKNYFPLQNHQHTNGIITHQEEHVGINPTRSAPDLLSHTSEPKGRCWWVSDPKFSAPRLLFFNRLQLFSGDWRNRYPKFRFSGTRNLPKNGLKVDIPKVSSVATL